MQNVEKEDPGMYMVELKFRKHSVCIWSTSGAAAH